jgi:hypothetical protein
MAIATNQFYVYAAMQRDFGDSALNPRRAAISVTVHLIMGLDHAPIKCTVTEIVLSPKLCCVISAISVTVHLTLAAISVTVHLTLGAPRRLGPALLGCEISAGLALDPPEEVRLA